MYGSHHLTEAQIELAVRKFQHTREYAKAERELAGVLRRVFWPERVAELELNWTAEENVYPDPDNSC